MRDKTNKLNNMDPDPATTSSSLIARAGQIMTVIITLGLVSMISSMLVSESLSGDAAQINHAGALRMMAIRISRAHLIDTTNEKQEVATEVKAFEKQLTQLFSGGLTSARENPLIESHYQTILSLWEKLKQQEQNTPVYSYDQFVSMLDQLVSLLQKESEKKLSMLRLIQGISLLSILVVAFVVLFRLNRSVVTPLKQLVEVASQAGQGNFELKANDSADNELGVLARTINQMSSQLKTTYQNFEERVAQKTNELIQTNQSLDFLYRVARHLSSNDFSYSKPKITNELETILREGKIIISVTSENFFSRQDIIIQQTFDSDLCLLTHRFPLKKHQHTFGYINWQTPKDYSIKEWQTLALKAVADIISTAIELEKQRSSQNRLLIMEERAVIARELHDSLAQSLSYLKVQMSLLTKKIQKDVPKEQITDTMDDIKQGINSAYLQLRELLTTFRLKLDDPSLENALQGTVTEFSSKLTHAISLDYQIPQNYFSANQEIHILQIVREALSNIQRHANATQAGVSISMQENEVVVEVWDNGKGIDKVTQTYGHFGLSIMQERANSLNSKVEIHPRNPKGTSIIVKLNAKRTNYLEV
ncbi:histidine kinase [Aliikangiella sp. IMCC44359]|uniref:histidine kinase n=1 Tax=Aliikangiella sp. IMCC44359 TaxID=3459125 RepID=UPI00403AC990